MRLYNDCMTDLYAWVWDLNTSNQQVVLNGARLNKGQEVGLILQVDGDRNYSIRWRVQTTDGTRENEGRDTRSSESIDQVLSVSV